MKIILVSLIALLMLLSAGCSSVDTTKFTKDTKSALDASVVNTTAIKALSARVDALVAENTVLKTQIADLKNVDATFATKPELSAAIAASSVAKEWIDVKNTANTASGQVAMLASRLTVLEKQQAAVNQQAQAQVVTGAWVTNNFATKGELMTLDVALRTAIEALKLQVVMK